MDGGKPKHYSRWEIGGFPLTSVRRKRRSATNRGRGYGLASFLLLPPSFPRKGEGRWVGISGRARVIVYSADLADGELPQSLGELTDPKWKGRIGLPPTNASFRVMAAAMRQAWEEYRTRQWLDTTMLELYCSPHRRHR